jgi:aryl-alcohol dehydrogenase-like predicted oxidoreductase
VARIPGANLRHLGGPIGIFRYSSLVTRRHPVANVGAVIELVAFGRTGHRSSRVIFGAAALSQVSQERADATLSVLREFGVNHLDTAAAYGDSELRLAPWLSGHRDEFFVATKTGERTGAGARGGLERSLERLGVDHVDLVQLHNLVEPGEWETAHGPGGAVEAMVQSRDEGLARFIGVTGHGLRIAGMHRRSLERFDFDTVLLPYSFVLLNDRSYRQDVDALLSLCDQRQVAVQTIKAVARRRWTDDYAGPRFSWYEAMAPGGELERAVAFVLGNRQLFLNSSSDLRLLRPILEAADARASAPSASNLDHDTERLGVEPLFDGAALDRI